MRIHVDSLTQALELTIPDPKIRKKIYERVALFEHERRIKEVEIKIGNEYTQSAIAYHQDWKWKQKQELNELIHDIDGIKGKMGI